MLKIIILYKNSFISFKIYLNFRKGRGRGIISTGITLQRPPMFLVITHFPQMYTKMPSIFSIRL